MHAIGTQDRTYCIRIIIDIPQKKQGVAATLAYLYVGPTHVTVVAANILHRYYFTINIMVMTRTLLKDFLGVGNRAVFGTGAL